ncbi:hypothetical protein BS78_K063600, partial [Paspalum vaginatum]
MGLSRRFQNLIVDSTGGATCQPRPFGGPKWLRCVDVTRQLFDNTGTPPSAIGDGSESAVVEDSTSQTLETDASRQKNKQAGVAAALKMERIRLPRPMFRKVVMADQTQRMFLCDVGTRHVVLLPNLHKKKSRAISMFVPSADAEDPSNSGCLYIMVSIPRPEKGDSSQLSDQFEAFMTSEGLWRSQLIPPPRFIRSYAVVGSNICVSAKCSSTFNRYMASTSAERILTYCLDTRCNTWEVGTRVLPFYGKAEHVPELKLWFGISSEDGNLAAADLSAMDMDSQPQLGWVHSRESLLAYLGSGRFCILRFFKPTFMDDDEMPFLRI